MRRLRWLLCLVLCSQPLGGGSVFNHNLSATTISEVGDVDADYDVDLVDFALFGLRWLDDCNAVNDWCDRADINKDGDADHLDLRILTSHWLLARPDITIGLNNELLVNGEKFFPLFVWDQRISGLDYLKGLGVNTIVGYDGGDGPVANWLDAGFAREMFMAPHIDKLDPNTARHPTLLAGLICHEPEFDDPANPGHPREYPSEIQQRHDDFKSQYPDILTISILSARFYNQYRSMCTWMNGDYSWYNQYLNLGDITSYDHYPVTGWNIPSRIYELGAATYDAYVNYLSKSKPIWPIIEASDQDLSWTPPETRGPYDYEMRAEAWLSIVNGAKAIGYFTIAFNPFAYNRLTEEIELEMTRTNAQITTLKDAILAQEPNDVTVAADATNDLTIQTMLRQHDSKVYIFAVEGDSSYDHTNRGSGLATFTLTGVPDNALITVYDESRTIQATGYTFADAFDELGVHIYIID